MFDVEFIMYYELVYTFELYISFCVFIFYAYLSSIYVFFSLKNFCF